ncbi:PepSY-associated TM helix domain-containing protein [Allomuricauda taeanensis]|uniref:PepSY-associated TM helix domain-containing protein n=1 Tax=Flagellimonas taeanensis TaxID=1005926 RepID=UPI002E7BBBAC|nr:PepSY-associated TM helix domain-containing protein [Allomuricauda taeanensis]MEE1963946.1 PepSY-associated TM helix domain-containing protein [Allomuricauda taeanensis]
MKLKSLKPRLHNAMFHTHTVSGIVISFALFVCFYAGAVALFKDEMYRWENPEARIQTVNAAEVDYDKLIAVVENNVEGFDKRLQFGIVPPNEKNPLVLFYGSAKDADGHIERFMAYIDPITYGISSGLEPKTHMAETIYELHFFNQLPVIGFYLSGFVSFFFLFAIITGLLTHWKNIVNKFYSFTTEGKWKQIWTNGHISLGVITLPFQLIYAVTGALLGLSILLLAPSAFLMFNGDTTEVLGAIRPGAEIKYEKNAVLFDGGHGFNSAFEKVGVAYPETDIIYMYSTNYGREDGTVTVNVDDGTGIGSDGTFVYAYRDGALLHSIEPDTRPYSKGAFGVLIKLHYATFGGLFLKIIYFILSMITCYIIISGIMIWRTARDNKRYTDKQRRFHHRVTKVYLAISLSMFPALALIFLGNKLIPMDAPNRIFYENSVFFWGWLCLAIMGLFWNDYGRLNRNYVLLGSLLGLAIPVANGIVTGDWLWKTWANGQYYVFGVDLTWIVIGFFGLCIWQFYLKGKKSSVEPLYRKGAQHRHPDVGLVESPKPMLHLKAENKLR